MSQMHTPPVRNAEPHGTAAGEVRCTPSAALPAGAVTAERRAWERHIELMEAGHALIGDEIRKLRRSTP